MENTRTITNPYSPYAGVSLIQSEIDIQRKIAFAHALEAVAGKEMHKNTLQLNLIQDKVRLLERLRDEAAAAGRE